jgi:hypothetical protein
VNKSRMTIRIRELEFRIGNFGLPRQVTCRISTFVLPSLLLLLISSALTPVFADTLLLEGGVPGVGCTSVTVTSGSAAFSCPASPLSGVLTSTAMGNLSKGVFGGSTTVSGVSFTTGGSTSVEVFVTYNFLPIPGVTNGTAQFDLSAPGTISCVGCPESGESTALFFVGSGESIGGALGPATEVALTNGSNNLVVTTQVGNGITQLVFQFDFGAACAGGPSYTGPACTSSVDFLDPISITGASVFDANGNLVPGASLLSQSGFNPNAVTPVPTPEPSGVVLLVTGLLVLSGIAKAKVITT